MIDISTALQNILKAVYGKDVRQSIHDAIFQINANANEAIDLAQIKFGTAITSPTSPTGSYIENTIYFNVMTGIVWRLDGGSWSQLGTFKAIDTVAKTNTVGKVDTYTITYNDGSTSTFDVTNGADGTDGVSIVNVTKTTTSGNVDHYEINLSDGTTTPSGIDVTNGSDGKSIANITLASTVGNVKNYDVMLDDGTKTPTGFSVSDGTSSYVHVRYSANFDGTGMVTVPTDATVYIGIVVTSQSVAPTDPSVYSWVRFIGKSGTGSGDMLKADYSTKYAGVVDKAAALYDGTNEIQANQLMYKTVYDADNDGIVDEADHATTADKVGNADTSVLEAFNSQSDGLHYHSNRILYDVDLLFNAYNANQFKIIQQGNNGRLELADPVTTKLGKVDNKIDKPSSATDGQVLTYNGTSGEWEAQASQGGVQFVIIVKGSDFEGQTVIATKDAKSKSAVITDGIARIMVDEGGVWTLTLTDGSTYKTPNMTYYGEYEVKLTPNGSTVTPTDNIQKWLECAGLNKSYTTISQVLADTNTLSALISDNNAVDYMVRSTTWTSDVCDNKLAMTYIGLNDYCANKLLEDSTWFNAICNSIHFDKVLNVSVPTLTSNTYADGGNVFYTSIVNGNQPWHIFNDSYNNNTDYTNGWYPNTYGEHGVGYKFPNKVNIRRIEFRESDYTDSGKIYYAIKTYKVQYSDTGNEEDFHDATELLNYGEHNKEVKKITINDCGYHKYWRFFGVEANSAALYVSLSLLQFYGRNEEV